MKRYAIQKQLVPVNSNDDTAWAQRDVWVFKLPNDPVNDPAEGNRRNEVYRTDDSINDKDDLQELRTLRNQIKNSDNTNRKYRIVKVISPTEFQVIEE